MFDEVYDSHFDFVWRNLRRLGVPRSAIDDAAQDVFLVVYRRLAGFEGRSSLRTWLAGIALRVASDHRRLVRRKGTHEPLSDGHADPSPGPEEMAARGEAGDVLHALLERLDDDKRAVFVLAELEQMTAPEIAEALGVGLNTVYSRLRLARQRLEEALAAWRSQTP